MFQVGSPRLRRSRDLLRRGAADGACHGALRALKGERRCAPPPPPLPTHLAKVCVRIGSADGAGEGPAAGSLYLAPGQRLQRFITVPAPLAKLFGATVLPILDPPPAASSRALGTLRRDMRRVRDEMCRRAAQRAYAGGRLALGQQRLVRDEAPQDVLRRGRRCRSPAQPAPVREAEAQLQAIGTAHRRHRRAAAHRQQVEAAADWLLSHARGAARARIYSTTTPRDRAQRARTGPLPVQSCRAAPAPARRRACEPTARPTGRRGAAHRLVLVPRARHGVAELVRPAQPDDDVVRRRGHGRRQQRRVDAAAAPRQREPRARW